MSFATELKERPWWFKYVICMAITGLLVLLYLLVMQFFQIKIPLQKVRIFSDACFIVGVMTLSVGCLCFVSANGVFDGLFYALKQFFWMVRVWDLGKKHESFYEYKKRLSEKPTVPYLFLVLIGIFWILLAGLFVYFFFKIESSGIPHT